MKCYHQRTELKGTQQVDGFNVKLKTRKRAIYHSQSAKLNKAHKAIRFGQIADNMPDQFMRIASEAKFKEQRSENQRENRRAKRNNK